jgi:hypothetical protein
MAVDDVANALMAMEDPEVRSAVRDGELSAIAAPDLTDDEHEMVMAAAQDDPDEEGYDVTTSLSARAVEYLSANQAELSPEVYEIFSNWIAVLFGGGVQSIYSECSACCPGIPGRGGDPPAR